MRNAEAAWSRFDAHAYLTQNYGAPRVEDLELIGRLVDFYSRLTEQLGLFSVVDVGTGPNLYPLLTALPFTKTLTAWEPAPLNLAYLRDAAESETLDSVWRPFWQALEHTDSRYRQVNPAVELAKRLSIIPGTIFELPSDTYDVASMHFCAESITSDLAEFEHAVQAVCGTVRPGGHVVASLMAGSEGYYAGEQWFPAVSINVSQTQSIFSKWLAEVVVQQIEIVGEPLRAGYEGMMLVTGKKEESDH